MNHPYNFGDLEDYKNSRMSDADRKAFEEVLAENEDLQRELEAVHAQVDIMAYLRKEALMEEMEKWRKEEEAEKRTVPIGGKAAHFKVRTLLAIAASLAVLLVAYFLFKTNNTEPEFVETPTETPIQQEKTGTIDTTTLPIEKKSNTEELVGKDDKKEDKKQNKDRSWRDEKKQDYSLFSNPGFLALEGNLSSSFKRAVDPNDTSFYNRALKLFQEKDYAGVEAMKQVNAPDNYSFLLALSLYHLKKHEAAAEAFHSIQEDLGLVYDAQWGEVLSLTAALPNSCAELVPLLASFKDNHPHHQKFMEIKKAIDLDKICH